MIRSPTTGSAVRAAIVRNELRGVPSLPGMRWLGFYAAFVWRTTLSRVAILIGARDRRLKPAATQKQFEAGCVRREARGEFCVKLHSSRSKLVLCGGRLQPSARAAETSLAKVLRTLAHETAG